MTDFDSDRSEDFDPIDRNQLWNTCDFARGTFRYLLQTDEYQKLSEELRAHIKESLLQLDFWIEKLEK